MKRIKGAGSVNQTKPVTNVLSQDGKGRKVGGAKEESARAKRVWGR